MQKISVCSPGLTEDRDDRAVYLGFSKTESSSTVEHFFDIIKTCLTEGTNVKISGPGSFIVRKKKARKGRNPQTGDEIEIAPRTVLSFRRSQVLREELNDRGEK